VLTVDAITRRNMLQAIAGAVAAAALAGCAPEQEAPPPTVTGSDGVSIYDAESLTLLAGVAFDIFPYPELDPAVYLRVAERALDLNDPDIANGIALLHENFLERAWVDVPEAERVDFLRLLQRSRLFVLLKSIVVEVLFRDPALWDIVGYGGSAIEQGGYLNNGFDTITWLPE
jgi:hypothetical protein